MSNVDIGAVGNKNIGAVQSSGGAPLGDIFNIPLGTLELDGIATSFITTENHFFNIPLGTLDLNGIAPTFTHADSHIFNIPLGEIELNGYTPRLNDGISSTGIVRFLGGENEII
jgi:hypothetical protein